MTRFVPITPADMVEPPPFKEMRVASSGDAKSLASAITHNLGAHRVLLRAIGAAAVNQAVKAVAIAEEMLASQGAPRRLALAPTMVTVTGNSGESLTGLFMEVFVRPEEPTTQDVIDFMIEVRDIFAPDLPVQNMVTGEVL